MQSVSTFFKEENDYLYRKGYAAGLKKGQEKKRRRIIGNVIRLSDFTDQEVADIMVEDIDLVKEVRAELAGK